MSRPAVIFCSLLFLELAACGRSSEEEATGNEASKVVKAPDSRACAIVTKEDVENALGRVRDIRGGAGSPATCVYHYAAARSGGKSMLDVVFHASDIASIKRATTRAIEPVHEVGDDAFWGGYASLYTGKGNATVVLTLSDSDMSKDQTRAKVIELTRLGLQRL